MEDEKLGERVVTSAIDSKTIAEIREGLRKIRMIFKEHSEQFPLYLYWEVFPGMTIERFAFLFIMGHHNKRHKKSKSCKSEPFGSLSASTKKKSKTTSSIGPNILNILQSNIIFE